MELVIPTKSHWCSSSSFPFQTHFHYLPLIKIFEIQFKRFGIKSLYYSEYIYIYSSWHQTLQQQEGTRENSHNYSSCRLDFQCSGGDGEEESKTGMTAARF